MVAATQAATWSSFSRERILRALLSVFSIRSEQRFPTRFRLPIEESNSKYAVGGSDLREELGDEIEGSISSQGTMKSTKRKKKKKSPFNFKENKSCINNMGVIQNSNIPLYFCLGLNFYPFWSWKVLKYFVLYSKQKRKCFNPAFFLFHFQKYVV